MSRQKKERKFLEDGVIDQSAMLAYLNNEMSQEEIAQFEALLKNDPFAQEALEGLQAVPSSIEVTGAVAELNKKVRERTGLGEGKTISKHWANYAWAAALLGVLIGIGAIMVFYFGKNDQIALNKEEQPSEEVKLFEAEKKSENTEFAPAISSDTIQMNTADEAQSEDNALELSKQQTSVIASETTQEKPKNEKAKAEEKPQSPASTTAQQSAANVNNISSSLADDKEQVKPTENLITETKSADKAADIVIENSNQKVSDKNAQSAPTTRKVVRGGIVEREEVGRETVVTLEDAMSNFNKANYKDASEQFDAILRQQGSNADALYFGGISDYINGNNRKSEKNFDKLLKEGSKYIEGSKWYKANILIQKGKRDEAKKLLDELSQTNGSYKERAVKKKAELGF